MSDIAEQLREAKATSLAQPLIRTARLMVDLGLEARPWKTENRPRSAHMALYPHIALEGTRPSVIAERLGITPQAVAQLVRDLEQMGLVERRPDPDDGRARRVAFTPLGHQDLLDGFATYRPIEAEIASQMGEQDFAELHRLLRNLEAIVESMEQGEAG